MSNFLTMSERENAILEIFLYLNICMFLCEYISFHTNLMNMCIKYLYVNIQKRRKISKITFALSLNINNDRNIEKHKIMKIIRIIEIYRNREIKRI